VNKNARTADHIVGDNEADALFSGLEKLRGLILAVSGGPDSTALLVLAARWATRRKRAPKLL
jgi:tRNA(Ile)-lysidine synthase